MKKSNIITLYKNGKKYQYKSWGVFFLTIIIATHILFPLEIKELLISLSISFVSACLVVMIIANENWKKIEKLYNEEILKEENKN